MAHAGGRPTTYKQEYCEMIVDYFDVEPITEVAKRTYNKDGTIKSEDPVIIPTPLPTFQGFAHSIGSDVNTMLGWKAEHEEFSVAYARAKALQEKIWLVNGMSGLYNSQFAQFFGKNCLGYKDKTETEHSGEVTITVEGAAKDWAK